MLKSAHKILLVLIVLLISFPAHADDTKRFALVIGNSAYTGSAPLKNPKNDAELISDTLNDVGFEVLKVTDADQKQMRRAMLDFSAANCAMIEGQYWPVLLCGTRRAGQRRQLYGAGHRRHQRRRRGAF